MSPVSVADPRLPRWSRTRAPAALPGLWDERVDGLMAAWEAVTGDVRAVATFGEELRQTWREGAAVAHLLGEADPEKRARACLVLGMTPAPDTVEPLLACLGDEAWLVREAARLALVAVGEAAVAPLIQRLQASPPLVREAACRILGALQAPEAVAALGACLTDEAWLVREAACVALGRFPGSVAREALEKAMVDPDAGVRRAACQALAAVPAAASRLRRALSDADPAVRLAACEGLAQAAPETTEVTDFVALTQDPVASVRAAAVRALGQRSDAVALRTLVQALDDPAARLAACEGLRAHPFPEALPGLVACLADARPAVRAAAGAALVATGEGTLASALLGVLDGQTSALPMREQLARAGDTRLRAPLLARLRDADAVLRRRACQALRLLAQPADTDVLLHCLRDPDRRVAWAARNALRRLEASYASVYRAWVCRKHLTRFERQRRWSRVGPVHYYGCRACGAPSGAFADIATVIAVLDEALPAPWVLQADVLRVDAQRWPTLFDFDRVDLIEAAPAAVERFCIAVANDTDRQRRLREVPCFVAATLVLPPNTERVLAATFRAVRRVPATEQLR